MARAGGKRNPKSGSQTSTSTKTTSTTTPTSKSTSSSTSIPDPFKPISSSLQPFVSTLPADHVYLVHVDRTPVSLKRRVFMVPVLLNLVLTAALAVRIYFAAPAYLELLITTFGYETSWTVKPQQMGVGDIAETISGRTIFLMIDYVLFALLGRWPWEFVMGDRKYGRGTGALEWRRTLGFQNPEIVVRKGRKWDGPLTGLDEDNKEKEEQRVREGKPGKTWTKEEELTVQMKLEAALSRTYTNKTGYLLLDKEWDLDFRGMIDAQKLIEKGTVKMADLEHLALVNVAGQWGLWYPHGEGPANGSATQTEEEDEKVQSFKKKLTEMGCEKIFFRWIEMIQYETSQSGSISESKKQEMLSELRQMLKDRGKDDQVLFEAIGGLEGVPGLEDTG